MNESFTFTFFSCNFFKDTHQKLRYKGKPIKYFKTTELHTVCIWWNINVWMGTTVSDTIWRQKKIQARVRFSLHCEHKILLRNLGCTLKIFFFNLYFFWKINGIREENYYVGEESHLGGEGWISLILQKKNNNVDWRTIFGGRSIFPNTVFKSYFVKKTYSI